jgi:hypothetical protein
VHEDVATEDERVRINLCNNTATAGSDVGEDALGFGVFAQRLKVEVVYGRTL